jgi:nucleoside-diphosphate-sugar epimerase
MAQLRNKRVLVTGGAGAIGSCLARSLCEENEVVIIDDLSSGHENLVPPHARLVKASILDESALDECLGRFQPEVVFHLAALFANQNSVEHPEDDLLTNGLGTMKLLRRAERLTCLERFVFASSSCVYSTNEVPFSETDPTMAHCTPYAISKGMGELYCNYWSRHLALPVVMLRLFNVYGPGGYPGQYRNVMQNFILRALQGKPLVVTGTGVETRDYTFVEDVLTGFGLAATRPEAVGRTFNLGTGIETTTMDLALRINDLCGNKAGVDTSPRREWDHYTRRSADISLAVDLLGYAPAVRLADGLAMTVAWIREHCSRLIDCEG